MGLKAKTDSVNPITNRRLLVVLLCFLVNSVCAQKPPVDYLTYENWPTFSDSAISDNGQYLSYVTHSTMKSVVLTIRNKENTWTKTIIGPHLSTMLFSSDSRYFSYISNDTLHVQELGNDNERNVAGVKSFKFSTSEKGTSVAYKKTNDDLILLELNSGREIRFLSVEDFVFNSSGSVLAIVTKAKGQTLPLSCISWIDTKTGFKKSIIQCYSISSLTFDPSGTRIAFITNDKALNQSIFSYQDHHGLILRAGDQSQEMPSGFVIAKYSRPFFSANGQNIFFKITRRLTTTSNSADSSNAKVEIWNYRDEWIHSQPGYFHDDLLAVNQEGNSQIIKLEESNLRALHAKNGLTEGSDKYLACFTITNSSDNYWRSSEKTRISIISVKDGTQITIAKELNIQGAPLLSPDERFVIWFDSDNRNYFCYCIKTGLIRNLSSTLPYPVYDELDDHSRQPESYGLGGFIKNTSFILVYDRYDIWMVDMTGKTPAKNITNQFGRRQKIVFRNIPFQINSRHVESDDLQYLPNESIFVSAFNMETKQNGIFKCEITGKHTIKELVMGSFIIYFPRTPPSHLVSYESSIVKAKNSDEFICTKMSPSLYPNLLLTSDFKRFTALTDIEPHKAYNWYTAELQHWNLPNGEQADGILYKPENFDPKKKYPLIFYFYERLSNSLNEFLFPRLDNPELSISYYTSNGYLVFVPDNYYQVGSVAESVYNTIVSAGSFLKGKKFVDTLKIGILGHSFGAYQVNCLLTKTKMFAAAASCAGISDLVSQYLDINSYGDPIYSSLEQGQLRVGKNLWEDRALFIANSPIFYTDNISTPVLFVHNKGDDNVPWRQSLELFLAMRRLGKQAWLLQYDGEDHFISQPKNQLDFSIRLTQFFDHYLKEKPLPKWMTIPSEENPN